MWQQCGLICLVALIGLSCGRPGEEVAASATDTGAPQELEVEEAQVAQPVPDSDDPFAVFGLESDTNAVTATSSVTPVWVINTWHQPLVVTAAGGAAVVVLETIGGTDSVLVRIETRARTVVLEALAPGSVSVGSAAVRMDSEPKRVVFPQ